MDRDTLGVAFILATGVVFVVLAVLGIRGYFRNERPQTGDAGTDSGDGGD